MFIDIGNSQVAFDDIASWVNDECLTTRAEWSIVKNRALSAPSSEGARDDMSDIAEDWEIKLVPLGEFFVTIDRAPIDANDFGISELLDNSILVTKPTGFPCAIQ